MGLVTRFGYLLGCIFIAHSAYSVYEHRYSLKMAGGVFDSVPKDIALESLCGLFLVIFSSFWGSLSSGIQTLEGEPVEIKVAANDSSIFKPIKMNKAMIEKEKIGDGPFDYIINRPAFIDITKKRKEFETWTVTK